MSSPPPERPPGGPPGEPPSDPPLGPIEPPGRIRAGEVVRLVTDVRRGEFGHDPVILDAEVQDARSTVGLRLGHERSRGLGAPFDLDPDALERGEQVNADERYFEVYTPRRYERARRAAGRQPIETLEELEALPVPTHRPTENQPQGLDFVIDLEALPMAGAADWAGIETPANPNR